MHVKNLPYGKCIWIGLFLVFSIFFLAVPALANDGNFRTFVKMGGLFGAILGIIGIAVAGYFAGKSYDSYTGWERYTHGAGQFYNRKRFRRDQPTYGIEEKTKRLSYIENLAGRMRALRELMVPLDKREPKWSPEMVIEGLSEQLKDFFEKHEDKYKPTLNSFKFLCQQKANWKNF
jgi:hypothetical protein